MFFENIEKWYFLLVLLDIENESEHLGFNQTNGSWTFWDILKKIHFHVGSVRIFVIVSVLLPLPSETENFKRKTLSVCEGKNFTGRTTHLGGFAVLEAIVVVWYDSKATRHCGQHSQIMGVCFPLHQELIYL